MPKVTPNLVSPTLVTTVKNLADWMDQYCRAVGRASCSGGSSGSPERQLLEQQERQIVLELTHSGKGSDRSG